MKKHLRIISFVLGIVMVLSLAACSPKDNAPAPADQGEIQGQDAADTPEAAEPMTAKDFCQLYEGTWKTNDGQIVYIGFQTETGEPIFVTGIEDSDVFYGPGSITDLVVLMENEYSLTVNFPSTDGEEAGFSHDAFDVTIRVSYSDVESKMLVIRFNDEPKTEYYFDYGVPEAVFDTSEDFWDYLFETGEGEKLFDPYTDNYVRFFDVGGSPRFLFGTQGFNEDSGIGEILEMTLEDGYALIITVRFSETMGNGGILEPARTEDYRIVTMDNIGVTVYAPDGNRMGNYYFGVG